MRRSTLATVPFFISTSTAGSVEAYSLSGEEWSSDSRDWMTGRKPVGIAWYFDFVNVRRSDDDGDIGLLDNYDKRALCVRATER